MGRDARGSARGIVAFCCGDWVDLGPRFGLGNALLPNHTAGRAGKAQRLKVLV
jgi:hypothetical protein